jgi:hypothetical protein
MKQLGTLQEIEKIVQECRERCHTAEMPFHADALAAALGISYDTLLQYAAGRGQLAALLKAALQECTADVVAAALGADPKAQSMWVFYLRNRADFVEKGEKPELPSSAVSVTFVGEEKI